MIALLPTPKKYETLDEGLHAVLPTLFCAVADWTDVAEMLVGSVEKIFSVRLTKVDCDAAGIRILKNPSLAENAYTLDSSNGCLTLSASSREGISYAVASALLLLQGKDGALALQALSIEDYPEKDYRAFMVDMGIVWHPFDKLLKYVDLCFLYKIKYLHLHVADNDIYCLPSRAFPKLNEAGKCYTYDEIAALNRYARARGVVLIPEFECPGHAVILNRHYPEVFGNHAEGELGKFYNELGAEMDTRSLICAGSERSFEGVKTLIGEMAELFPESPYLHIGGDEASHKWWDQCRDCRAYMQANNIPDTHALYGEYVGRVAKYVLSLGRTPIVWEGFSKDSAHYVPKETVVIAWESHYQLPHELLENGFRIVNASWQPTYFVTSLRRRWTPEDLMNWNLYNWQHWWPKSAATEHPIQLDPTEDVLGASLCSWGLTYEWHITRLLENFPAFAERTWTTERKLSNDDYRNIYRKIEGKAPTLIGDR